MSKYLTTLFFSVALAWSAKPMESLTNYNVIMIHGAADAGRGMKNGEVKEHVCGQKVYEKYGGVWGSANMMGYYYNNDEKNEGEYNLTYWLDSAIFENVAIDGNGKRKYLSVNTSAPHFSSIYLQRPFLNPAESPRYNARELGDRTWTGDAVGCNERRSLIEEAQEVRAKGRENLADLRKNAANRDSLPPSRNILIAHSMGGVASREYVQSDSVYNEDVDKVVTLDSPHEGTQALSLLIGKHEDWGVNIAMSIPQLSAWWLILASIGEDAVSNYLSMAMYLIVISNFAQESISDAVDYFYLRDKFPYESGDPLAYYIDPNNIDYKDGKTRNQKTVEDLKTKKYNPNIQTPMFRLQYSTKALTFTDPKHSAAQTYARVLFPDALATPVQNFYSQLKKDNISGAFASMYLGAFGFGLADIGSSLVPEWSGKAENTPFLNGADVDVKKVPYDGTFYSKDISGIEALLISSASTMAIVTAALVWTAPQFIIPTKIGVTIGMGTMATALIAGDVIPFINDFEPSHKAPATSKYQSGWKGTENTYSKISGGNATVITPYQMEDFLYEKPFANVRIKSSYSSDWKDTLSDTLGLYIGDSLEPLYIAKTLENFTPLKFKSTSDWETMGAKKERWEITKGVGDEKVPIRHADRHPMPSIMVKDFIRRYEFEIDDLMPHRLRQIRLNFNFNEELAWECDINKNPADVTACVVFRRSPASNGWQNIGNEKHPVNERGIFVFEPDKYYNSVDNKVGLGAIQKDNQNTVILSMVNKVGLSNSQRFYYLFKATADLVEPSWPLRNIRVSNMNGFKAYISALDYQDISVLGGEERIVPKSNDLDYSELLYKPMSAPLRDNNGYLLTSLSNYNGFASGEYDWEIIAETGDISDPNKNSKSTMIVPFTLDTTLPRTKLTAERKFANPDSLAFLARFENETEIDESLRLAAFFLKQNNQTLATAKFSNVLAPSFGVLLQDFKDSLGNKIERLADGGIHIGYSRHGPQTFF